MDNGDATAEVWLQIYLWAPIYRENWSAFAPDFEELEENREYVEREDEFDINEREEDLIAAAAAAAAEAAGMTSPNAHDADCCADSDVNAPVAIVKLRLCCRAKASLQCLPAESLLLATSF